MNVRILKGGYVCWSGELELMVSDVKLYLYMPLIKVFSFSL